MLSLDGSTEPVLDHIRLIHKVEMFYQSVIVINWQKLALIKRIAIILERF